MFPDDDNFPFTGVSVGERTSSMTRLPYHNAPLDHGHGSETDAIDGKGGTSGSGPTSETMECRLPTLN